MSGSIGRFVAVVAIAAFALSCSDAPPPMAADGNFDAVAAAQPGVADFRTVSREVLALPGAVWADLDEATGLIRLGIDHPSAAPGIQQALSRVGVARSAYTITVTEPVRFTVGLSDAWDETVAGIQIAFGAFACSLGANVDDGDERSFLTASHCSKRQGSTDGTEYYQPVRVPREAGIATEVEDAEFFRGGDCPRGRKCRYSDATRALYADGAASVRGSIAKTDAANSGSTDVLGAFTVTAQDNATESFTAGTVLNKVGIATGWTRGEVISSCVDVNVFSSNITLLCQTFVRDPGDAQVVGAGDSGAGVFRITGGDNVELVGILWGGNFSDTEFIFSPLSLVRLELGAVTGTQ